MGQITIYLENEIEQKMIAAAKSAHLSKSKWIAKLVQEKVANEWPQSIKKIAGSWKDFPTIDEIRDSAGKDCPREQL